MQIFLKLNFPVSRNNWLDAIIICVWCILFILNVLVEQAVLDVLALLQVFSIARVYDFIWASFTKN